MASAFDAAATLAQVTAPTSPQTLSITLVGTGANRQAMVHITVHKGTQALPVISAVTVGTDSLAFVTGTTVAGEMLETWGGALTVTGTQTVTVTFSNSGLNFSMAIFAISATGTDLVNNGNTATNGASPLSLSMTSAAGDLTSTVLLDNGTGNFSTNRTSRGNGSVVSPTGFDSGPGTVNPTHTYTTTGLDWSTAVASGANFRALVGTLAEDGLTFRSTQVTRRIA
jgi:hypothetical protein